MNLVSGQFISGTLYSEYYLFVCRERSHFATAGNSLLSIVFRFVVVVVAFARAILCLFEMLFFCEQFVCVCVICPLWVPLEIKKKIARAKSSEKPKTRLICFEPADCLPFILTNSHYGQCVVRVNVIRFELHLKRIPFTIHSTFNISISRRIQYTQSNHRPLAMCEKKHTHTHKRANKPE